MPTTFRVATFNVENLFSRAKALNLKDNQDTADILTQVGKLQQLLKKPSYTGHKVEIKSLYNDLKEYIEIREDRNKLFKRTQSSGLQVVASGAGDWDGGIEFKRDSFSEMTRENTAKVVNEIEADVQCLVEGENREALGNFNMALLSPRFPFNMLIDGNDERGIDVGLYSKHPLGLIRTHIFDTDAQGRIFSRDCLEIEVQLPGGRGLFVLVNHFKSKGFGTQAASNARRKRQAERVRDILDGYDLTADWVVVAGDLNDTPDSAPLEPLLSTNGLHDVLALQFPAEPAKRWTYHFRGDFEQIDYLLVSEALRQRFEEAGVERRGIHGLAALTDGAEEEFASVTHASNAASDHGAVWADFTL